MAEYNFKTPVSKNDVEKLRVGDVVFLSGDVFTARDRAHSLMLKESEVPFTPSDMVLYHCGPLMQKKDNEWDVVSAGPTTSSRMELFEGRFIEKFGIRLIIGKGDMGKDTQKALQKYTCIYASYTGGAGAMAANSIKKVKNVFWLDELGMAEAVWLFEIEKFGPLVVSMDSQGNSIFENR